MILLRVIEHAKKASQEGALRPSPSPSFVLGSLAIV